MAKKSITAAELMAELANNPEYQRMMQAKEAARSVIEEKLRDEERPLVQELQRTGMTVVLDRIPGQEYSGPPRSISDLVNTGSRYPEAIPVLTRHLQVDYSLPIRESIVRALITPDSGGYADILIAAFEAETDSESELKWLLGSAIAEAATDSDADRLIALANDLKHGRGREFLPLGLAKAAPAKALPELERWIDDKVLGPNSRKVKKLLLKSLKQLPTRSELDG